MDAASTFQIPTLARDLWRPELALLVTIVVGFIASLRPGRWLRYLMLAGLSVAIVLAIWSGRAITAGMPIGVHAVIDAPAALARMVILLTALLVVTNLSGPDHRAAISLVLAALGAIVLGQVVSVGGMLLATTMVIAGGTLTARFTLDPAAEVAVRRWHATATLGFALLAVGAGLYSGLGGSLTLMTALDHLALRPSLPPLVLPLALGLVAVGLALAMLGEPGRFGATAPPPVTAWLTTVPALGLTTLLMRVLAAAPDAPALATLPLVFTAAAGLLMLGGFLAAAVQPRLERRLAWAATGQTGLALLGLTTLDQAGATAAFNHLLFFVPAQLGALLVAGVVASMPATERRRHLLAFLLALLLVALAALPPLAGWRPRLALVQALITADRGLTAGLVLAGTLLGGVVYLRPLVDLWRPAGPVTMSDPSNWSVPVTPTLTAAALFALLLAWGLGLLG